MDSGPDLIDATLGQYQIEALIGRGGMGYVYRARDTVLARPVALKILPPDVVSDASRLSRFVQEARAASALNHPHVIAIYEIREATAMRAGAPIPDLPALHYLAMELGKASGCARSMAPILSSSSFRVQSGTEASPSRATTHPSFTP